MYYLTYYQPKQPHQLTLEELFNGVTNTQETAAKNITVKTNNTEKYLIATNEINNRLLSILDYIEKWSLDINTEDLTTHYHTFRIPKKTDGYREINAPDDNMKTLQNNVRYMFDSVLKILPHDAAYAYVKNRSTVDALKKHQEHDAQWFLKIDIKDFFPSHNIDYIMSQLHKIYPTAVLFDTHWFPTTAEETKQKVKKILELCLLNNELPQGSPLSPTLTNILMAPIDYEIEHMLYKEHNFFTYTRYADDIIISSPKSFNWKNIVEKIHTIFTNFNAPFVIKNEKTRYGSNSGRNWNLGLMYNKNQNITIGHEKKQRFRAKIHQFCSDCLTDETRWNTIQTQQLAGEIAYYKMIEPDYIEYVLDKYNKKFNCNITQMIKSIITN